MLTLLVSAGSLTIGELTAFLVYTLLFELLDREAEIPLSGGDTLPRLAGELELRGLHFR